MGVETRHLQPADDRSAFRSGDPDLDRFFLKYAGQNQFRHHLGVTYVAVEDAVILGFATVSPAELAIEDLPEDARKGLPRYPLPVMRLARLAVDERAQGQGIGGLLMKTVFVLARKMAKDFGCVGVVVDAKATAVRYYERFGFEPLDLMQGGLGDRPQPTAMFLELGAIPEPDNDRQ